MFLDAGRVGGRLTQASEGVDFQMAIMEGTTSPASRSRSPASSETSAKPTGQTVEAQQNLAASVETSTVPDAGRRTELVQAVLRCEWDECGEGFSDVHGLVDHLENGEREQRMPRII
jgi:hypothetical protein